MSHFGKPGSATLQWSTLDKINAVITVDSDERVSERRMQRICLQIVYAISFQDFQPDHKSPTLQTDGRTDGRHAIARPRAAVKCIAR